MDTRTIRHLFAAAAAFASVLLPGYSISSVSGGAEAAIRTDEVASLQAVSQAAEHAHDLAIVSIKAPRKVTLSSKKPTVVKTVKLAVQNRSPYTETIPDQNTLTDLVSLTVVAQSAESGCSTPVAVLHAGKPQPVFPVTLKPNKTLKIVFDVTFTCAVDPLKGAGHEDFQYIAQVDASALDGQEDMYPDSDVCPRAPVPVVDGSPEDKGCGGKLPGKILGGPVLSDVVVKEGADGGTGGIPYTGNANPASITATNASALIANVIGGANTTESLPGVVQPQAVRESANGDPVITETGRLLSYVRAAAKIEPEAAGQKVYAAASIPIDETMPCDSGSMTLSGSLNKKNGQGTLAVIFDACTTDGETANGAGTLRIDAMDLNYLEITDGLFSFPLLTITSTAVDVSMSFDARIELNIDANLERFTLNMVTRDNRTGDMLKFENLIDEDVYYPYVLSPTSYTQTLKGRVYDSTHGYVDVLTPVISPLGYSSMEQMYPDSGVLVLTGVPGNLRLVAESATHVAISLDSDGDQVFETGVTLLWNEIGEPIADDIGDNDGDGMHNSWETTYGLNPDDPNDALLDSDEDGVSNHQEYLDRTHPTSFLDQSFVPSDSAAYQANIIYRPLDSDYVNQAQTFTVGITGQLTDVQVLINGFSQTADLVVDVRPTVNGVPVSDDSAILGEVAIPASEIPGFPFTFVNFDFYSRNIHVTSGDELAVVMRIDKSSQGGDYGWRGDTGDKYSSGVAYTRGSTYDWFAPTSDSLTVDYGFKTFVRADP